MDTIVSLISSVGFPIAMCVVVCYYVYKKDTDHKAEIDKLSDAVNQQTLNIQRLIDKIDRLIGGDNHAEQ